jgi:hypothetical protein
VKLFKEDVNIHIIKRFGTSVVEQIPVVDKKVFQDQIMEFSFQMNPAAAFHLYKIFE